MSILTAEFAKAAAKARPVKWDRAQLVALRDRRSVDVLANEKRLLRDVMGMAKRSPTARAALAWAQEHNIEFIIDYATTAGGYYTRQTGVVAISQAAAEGRLGMFYGVEVLVHEIRHAWQDHHRMLPSIYDYRGADLARVTIQQALYEADAYAHGKLASAQCMGEVGSPLNYLRYHFREWYAGSRADVYGNGQREYQGAQLHVANCKAPNHHVELKGSGLAEVRTGLDPWRREDIEKLGKSFADLNYLASWKNDYLWKRILSPESALRQFNDKGRAGRVAEAVRVRQLQQRMLRARMQKRQEGYAPARKLPG